MDQAEYRHINDSGGSYIVIEDVCEIIEYQKEIISQNSIPGLLPVHMKEYGEKIGLYYNITSRHNISDYLKSRIVSKIEFLEILLQISEIILDCKNYLLYSHCLSLNTDHIFLETDALSVKLLYCPVDMKSDINAKLKEFIKDYIINIACVNEDNDGFLLKVINFIKKETFSVMGFYKLISSLKHNHVNKMITVNKSINKESALKAYIKNPGLKTLLQKLQNKPGKATGKYRENIEYTAETELLYNCNEKWPLLKSLDNASEIIEIDRPGFLIGRLKNHVDFLSANPSLGKIHAEILMINNKYYLKDLNSKNGSFINDTRIGSNKRYEIRNNDIVKFANTEYVFVIPGDDI